jgi:hypothetical protein
MQYQVRVLDDALPTIQWAFFMEVTPMHDAIVYSIIAFFGYWSGVSLARVSSEVQDRMVRLYYPDDVLPNVKYTLG